MLVFGDKAETRPARAALAAAERIWSSADGASGLERHARLVSGFIAMAELTQGLGDAAFDAAGCDDPDPAVDAATRLLEAMAREVMRSWDNSFDKRADAGTSFDIAECFQRLRNARLPAAVTCKQAEGSAFYALYPEAYARAARCSGLGPDTLVIGLRSIGTGLAAMVAAALGARSLTLRPHGDPFARKVVPGPELTNLMLSNAEASFALVDEGPGLSGSSFGCVADWLEDHGVARDRIHTFPSHDGPLGLAVSERHRDRWAVIERHVAGFDEAILPHLPNWVSDLVPGTAASFDRPLRWALARAPDLGGGRLACGERPAGATQISVPYSPRRLAGQIRGIGRDRRTQAPPRAQARRCRLLARARGIAVWVPGRALARRGPPARNGPAGPRSPDQPYRPISRISREGASGGSGQRRVASRFARDEQAQHLACTGGGCGGKAGALRSADSGP